MHKAKDYPNLLNAIVSLKKLGQDFVFCIAEDGALREIIVLLANKLDISDVVEFLGIRYDITALMSSSDIFVLSSAWEGFGLVVAEAMVCERVIVATDCGGICEIVDSSGFLVELRNSELLAKELDRVLSLSDYERSKLGAAGRQRIIDKFSLEANVNDLELYIQHSEKSRSLIEKSYLESSQYPLINKLYYFIVTGVIA